MAAIKTQKNDASVEDFLSSVPDTTKREDGFKLLTMFREITGETPKMWGTSMVGFGQYHYKSERSSQEGDWFMTGFSPRKAALTLYVLSGFPGQDTMLEKLGKHKKGIGCLYINKLADVDEFILKDIIKKSYNEMKKRHSA
jgi:hypothetical protein